MQPAPSPRDALVLFGVTGDLAAKMLLPALARLGRQGVRPRIIGVARAPRDPATILTGARQQLGADARDLGADVDALAARFTLVDGDLADASTYQRVAEALGRDARPLFYLAIPPQLFTPAIQGIARAGLARAGAVALEKPFGHDLESARALERTVAAAFAEEAVFRIDHFLGKDPVRNLADMRARTAWLEPLWSHAHVRSVQITMAEDYGIGTRGAFYERVGALRDVFQNHLLELCAVIAMEPVAPADGDAFSASRIEALRAIAPLAPDDIVYGQYEGYRNEAEVARDSQVATYVAARVSVDSPRFAGVPFYIRAGKRLPLTNTMVTLTLTRARTMRAPADELAHERLRFRLGPGAVAIDIDTASLLPGTTSAHENLTLHADLPVDQDRDAYVNLLGAALAGDRSMSERASGVAAAWRVVEGVLRADIPVHAYPIGSWGPDDAARLLRAGERWVDPPAA